MKAALKIQRLKLKKGYKIKSQCEKFVQMPTCNTAVSLLSQRMC